MLSSSNEFFKRPVCTLTWTFVAILFLFNVRQVFATGPLLTFPPATGKYEVIGSSFEDHPFYDYVAGCSGDYAKYNQTPIFNNGIYWDMYFCQFSNGDVQTDILAADPGCYYQYVNRDCYPVQLYTPTAGLSFPDIPSNADKGPGVCTNSSVNVTTGAVLHDQTLFVAGTPRTGTTFQLFYNSRDVLSTSPSDPVSPYVKTPLGQGWSHSYDISLFKNQNGDLVLRGGGLQRRLYTLQSDGTYVSEPDDSSTLTTVLTTPLQTNPKAVYVLTGRDGTVYLFDSNYQLLNILDRFGNVTTLGRDADNNPVSVTDPAGRVTQINYANQRISTITDPGGNVNSFAYDQAWSLAAVVSPTSGTATASWQYAYDPTSHMMVQKTDPNGNISEYAYDNNQRNTLVLGPDNFPPFSSLLYPDTPMGIGIIYATGSTSVTRENGGTWSYGLSSVHDLTSMTDPAGNGTTYTYDGDSRVQSETLPVDAVTSYVHEYQYDADGNVIDILGHTKRVVDTEIIDDPADLHLGFTYDSSNFDQLTSMTNYMTSPAAVTTYTYGTAAGGYQTVTEIDPAGLQTVVRLETFGEIHDVTHPDGTVQTFTYDSTKQLSTVTNPDGTQIVYSNRDGNGHPQTVKAYDSTGALRQTTTLAYDAAGNLTSSTITGLRTYTTNFGYDNNRDVTSVQDANANLTQITYNHRRQVTSIINALSKTTQLAYGGCPTCSGLGQITALTDANQNQTSWEYDIAARLQREIPATGDPIRYDYTAANLVWHAYNDRTNAVILTNVYDARGRLARRDYADGGWETYTYGPNGLLASAANQNTSYTYAYDAAGRILTVTDASGKVVAYGYDSAGRKQTMTALAGTSDQHVVSYGYDSAGRAQSVASSLAGTFTYGYDTFSRRASLSYPNGVTGTYTYHPDQPGWLTGISYSGTGGNLYSVSYPDFDMVGNRLSKVENSATSNFVYDAVYQLLTVTGATPDTFTYDAAGNRLSDSARLYSIGTGNAMQSAGTTSFTYDGYGNTLTAGPWSYTWNSAGQLVGATNGTTTASYAYDPFGRRVSKTVNGTTTAFVYDGSNIVASITGGIVTHFVQGVGTDEHLAVIQGGMPYFYHSDGLGSVTTITDGSQNIVQSYGYASFGQPTSSTAFQQPYQFTGRELDNETGLMYYRARYYDSSTGRFTSRDKLGFAGGDVVLSNYVGGNPVNLIDPTGNNPAILIGAGIGAVNGFITGIRQGNLAAGVVGGITGGIIGGLASSMIPVPAVAGMLGGAAGGAAAALINGDDIGHATLSGGVVGGVTGLIGGSAVTALSRAGADALGANLGGVVSAPFDFLGNLLSDRFYPNQSRATKCK